MNSSGWFFEEFTAKGRTLQTREGVSYDSIVRDIMNRSLVPDWTARE